MNSEVLAQNVKRLRVTRGISQQALADASGISLPAIKNIELAKGEARMSTIQKIAKALDAKIQNLLIPIRGLQVVRFRSARKMQNRENVLIDVERWLDNYNFLETILEEKTPFRLKEFAVEVDGKSIIELANSVRKKFRLKKNEPIHDICGLLESAGVKILLLPTYSDSFFGLSVGVKDGGPAVIVNVRERIPVERRIFTAAHELGHLLMHPGAYDVNSTGESKEEEHQADVFASHFLMPDEGFLGEWKDASGLHWVDRVLKVKRIYRVSYKTVLYRLIELGLTDASIWGKFQQDYSKRYGRTLHFKEEPMALDGTEPASLKKFDFLEDRYTRLVREAIEKEKISLSRGAEMLGLRIDEMRELLRGWRTVL